MRRKPPGPSSSPTIARSATRFVAGADEAGRGCLAGPLVAAAVLFDQRADDAARTSSALASLNDSKMQTPAAPRRAVPGDPQGRRQGLDRLALRARHRRPRAARDQPRGAARGARNVACEGAICLSDGFSLGDIGYEHSAVIKGDATSAAIAAASVLAKETRDRYMRRVDERNPGWGFAQHVGYASPEHRSAIERLGVTPLHRLSFQSAAYQQLTLG